MTKATARAHSNIALVKYWGKRDIQLNLPARGSVSMTLEGLSTETTVEFGDDLSRDELKLNEEVAHEADRERISGFLDLIRAEAGIEQFARIQSSNNFPTAAGLASSASGFAALALAGSTAAGLDLSKRELSILARRGSGSAARSIFGGFVRMHAGNQNDGLDAYAEPIEVAEHWDLRCVVAVTARGPKKVGSTLGMNTTERTSPYYRAWLDTVNPHIEESIHAIRKRDFEHLADVAEASCLAMHASAIAARPGVLYWRGITVGLIHFVRELRASGLPVFFTIDAGPHVKVFCEGDAVSEVRKNLQDFDGVIDTITAKPGGSAELIEE